MSAEPSFQCAILQMFARVGVEILYTRKPKHVKQFSGMSGEETTAGFVTFTDHGRYVAFETLCWICVSLKKIGETKIVLSSVVAEMTNIQLAGVVIFLVHLLCNGWTMLGIRTTL